jgi:hypothetical protein
MDGERPGDLAGPLCRSPGGATLRVAFTGSRRDGGWAPVERFLGCCILLAHLSRAKEARRRWGTRGYSFCETDLEVQAGQGR